MELDPAIEELNNKLKEPIEEWSEREKNLGVELILPTEITFLRKLGEGTSAIVYCGNFKGEEVAIKLLKENIDPKLWEDFKKELKVMSIVKGARVVQFHGVCLRPLFFIVMEFCQRGTLLDVLKDTSTFFDWDKTFNMLYQTIDSVKFLHEFNPQIVHRDLKSLNLLVDKDWNVKVCDFGLSRQTEEGMGEDTQSINTTSTLYKLRGTYGYAAPELYNKGRATTKADIFSLAVVMWEILYRALKGEWARPYSEYKNFTADFHILIGVAKRGIRPTIPDSCPNSLKMMLSICWSSEPTTRPDCNFLLNNLKTIRDREFKEKKSAWDALLPVPPDDQNETKKKTKKGKKDKKKKKKGQ